MLLLPSAVRGTAVLLRAPFRMSVGAALTMAAVLASGQAARAVTWTGAESNDWTDPNNWSPATVPTASIDASISLPGVTITTASQTVRALTLGDTLASTGTLTITAGTTTIGSLTASGATTVGNLGTGILTVSGGATFTASGAVNLGNSTTGSGDLEILSGGNVTVSGFNFVTFGAVAGSTGSGNISGTGSSFSASILSLGGGGNGLLALANSGHLSASLAFSIGNLSNGTFTMNSNATATVGGMTIGQLGTGLANISDSGTKLTSTGTITLGAFTADGNMNITNGAAVETSVLTVGAASAGNLTISGAGSSMTVDSTTSSGFVLGQSTGSGNVSVLNGGLLTTQNGIAGFVQSGGHGSGNITVSGSNSTWSNAATMDIAQQATTASLSVLAGGRVTTNTFQSDGNGTVTIDGANSSLTSTLQYTVGTLANATQSLTVSGGGAVSAQLFQFGLSAGSSSNATITGANSSLHATNYLYLGQSGAANMTVSGGANVSIGSGGVILGVIAGSSGNMTLTDAGTRFVSTGSFAVGSNGTASLLIENGAVLTSPFGEVGDNAAANVTITGAGSLWDTSAVHGNVSTIATYAAATMTISAGGEFRVADLFVANNTGGPAGSVTVTGAGSKLTSTADLDFGVGATGTLTVANGGLASAPGLDGIVLGGTPGALGILNVGSGGLAGSVSATIVSGGFVLVHPVNGTGTGIVNFNHTDAIVFAVPLEGALTVNQMAVGNTTLTANNTYSGTTSISLGALQLGNGGISGSIGNGPVTNNAALVFDRSNVLTVANALSGNGTVSQIGAGTTLLSGANTYSGQTTISGGKLFAENTSGSATGTSPVITQATATLGGGAGAANGGTLSTTIPGTYASGAVGTIGGAVTVATGGIVAPGGTTTGGDSVGTLTVSSLALSPLAVLDYDFNSASGTNDFTAVTALAGLTFTTAGFNLYQEGTTTPFGTPGTYHLLGYNGVPIGLPTGLTVLDPVVGDVYLFTLNPALSTVDLTIVGTPLPEPASLALLASAGFAMALRRRGR